MKFFVNNMPRYWRDRNGSVAVWMALLMPVLIGSAALSVDVSRMYNLEHELQIAADSLARSGAAELDQRGDSIERAQRAVANLVANSQKFGNQGAGEITPQSIRFLEDLPNNDYEIPGAEFETTDPYKAKYIEIEVIPETVKVIFSRTLASTVSSVTLDARSIAGTGNGICGAAPIFVCNPYENTSDTIYEAMETAEFQRRQIQFKTPRQVNDNYGPGNFGFLDPYGTGDNSKIDDAIAIDTPPICINKAGVNLRTGNIASLRVAFNTRFDIYEGKFKKFASDPRYAPAENVTKGYTGGGCNTKPDEDALGLPRDACFADDSCTLMDGRLGNGDWDFVSYMETNHNGAQTVNIADVTYSINYAARTHTPIDPPSRYNIYRWEIDSGSIPGAVSYGTSSTPEEGTPQCHASGPSTASIDRRIMYAAVLNCEAVEAEYGMNGSKKDLPVETFVKVFLTEPMGKSSDNTIWGEIVGPIVKGTDVVARDRVNITR